MSVRVYNVERAALVFGPCASGAGDVWRSGTRESPIAERLTPYVKPLYRGRVRETVLVIHVVECKPECLWAACCHAQWPLGRPVGRCPIVLLP